MISIKSTQLKCYLEWCLFHTDYHGSAARISQKRKSRAVVGNSFVCNPSCCQTERTTTKVEEIVGLESNSMRNGKSPRRWSRKIRGVEGSELSIQSMILSKISIRVPSKHFFAWFSPTLPAQTRGSKQTSSRICWSLSCMSRTT